MCLTAHVKNLDKTVQMLYDGGVKTKLSPVRIATGLVAATVILACGGSGTTGNNYPLVTSVRLRASNLDVDNIHFLINTETFSASNRVAPSTTMERTSEFSYTWDSATQVNEFRVYCGRGGVVLDSEMITMSGDQRMQGKKIAATWDGTDVIVNLVDP
ncbi:MAG: hypothetical protein AMXMBFR81_21510 [Chthonomonas sp.]